MIYTPQSELVFEGLPNGTLANYGFVGHPLTTTNTAPSRWLITGGVGLDIDPAYNTNYVTNIAASSGTFLNGGIYIRQAPMVIPSGNNINLAPYLFLRLHPQASNPDYLAGYRVSFQSHGIIFSRLDNGWTLTGIASIGSIGSLPSIAGQNVGLCFWFEARTYGSSGTLLYARISHEDSPDVPIAESFAYDTSTNKLVFDNTAEHQVSGRAGFSVNNDFEHGNPIIKEVRVFSASSSPAAQASGLYDPRTLPVDSAKLSLGPWDAATEVRVAENAPGTKVPGNDGAVFSNKDTTWTYHQATSIVDSSFTGVKAIQATNDGIRYPMGGVYNPRQGSICVHLAQPSSGNWYGTFNNYFLRLGANNHQGFLGYLRPGGRFSMEHTNNGAVPRIGTITGSTVTATAWPLFDIPASGWMSFAVSWGPDGLLTHLNGDEPFSVARYSQVSAPVNSFQPHAYWDDDCGAVLNGTLEFIANPPHTNGWKCYVHSVATKQLRLGESLSGQPNTNTLVIGSASTGTAHNAKVAGLSHNGQNYQTLSKFHSSGSLGNLPLLRTEHLHWSVMAPTGAAGWDIGHYWQDKKSGDTNWRKYYRWDVIDRSLDEIRAQGVSELVLGMGYNVNFYLNNEPETSGSWDFNALDGRGGNGPYFEDEPLGLEHVTNPNQYIWTHHDNHNAPNTAAKRERYAAYMYDVLYHIIIEKGFTGVIWQFWNEWTQFWWMNSATWPGGDWKTPYMEMHTLLSDFVKELDPTAKIAVGESPNFTSSAEISVYDEVLANKQSSSKPVDVLTGHYYQGSLGAMKSGMLQIQQKAAQRNLGSNIPFYATEWSIEDSALYPGTGVVSVGGAPFKTGQAGVVQRDAYGAAFLARAFLFFQREGFAGANYHWYDDDLLPDAKYGIVSSLHEYAPFHAMALWRKMDGCYALPMTMDLPAGMDAMAFQDPSTNKVYIYLAWTSYRHLGLSGETITVTLPQAVAGRAITKYLIDSTHSNWSDNPEGGDSLYSESAGTVNSDGTITCVIPRRSVVLLEVAAGVSLRAVLNTSLLNSLIESLRLRRLIGRLLAGVTTSAPARESGTEVLTQEEVIKSSSRGRAKLARILAIRRAK